MAAKVCTGDVVEVISGSDKGKSGKVLKVFVEDNKVLVSGVNVRSRHTKPSAGGDGGIISKELPVHISNVTPIVSDRKSPARIGFDIKEGKKVRVDRKTGKEIKAVEVK